MWGVNNSDHTVTYPFENSKDSPTCLFFETETLLNKEADLFQLNYL